ncbi:MAG: hypothetical protein JO041_04065, partial [Acidobacteria bacterium]|nr:hypothetical protein [Acidobacteriota bacterium]
MRRVVVAIISMLWTVTGAAGQPGGAGGGGQRVGGGEMQTVSARTAGLQKHDGFLPFYWDA